MMDDYRKTDAIYKTTNYWYKKTKRLYGFLRQNGLRDFRRNNDPKGTAEQCSGPSERPKISTQL